MAHKDLHVEAAMAYCKKLKRQRSHGHTLLLQTKQCALEAGKRQETGQTG